MNKHKSEVWFYDTQYIKNSNSKCWWNFTLQNNLNVGISDGVLSYLKIILFYFGDSEMQKQLHSINVDR